jgi:hypothetical protein
MENNSVSTEDRTKLEQISREIMKGVREIADILAANMNQKSGGPIEKFSISLKKSDGKILEWDARFRAATQVKGIICVACSVLPRVV